MSHAPTPTLEKSPTAIVDYVFSWADWLADADILSAATVTCTDPDLTIDDVTFTDTEVTCWFSGGVLHAIYPVICRITTSGGRSEDDSLTVHVLQQ